jgi:hypothetical protein
MAATTNFGPLTLPTGARTFGPHLAANSDTAIRLTVDRTLTGGLNALTASSTIEVNVELSDDGGATWHATDTDQAGTKTAWTTAGGIFTDRFGQVATVSGGAWFLFPGTSRQLRATITVAGPSPIAVAGSIVTQ